MSVPLSEIAKVVHGEGDYSSKLVSMVDLEPGALFANIKGSKQAPQRNYTTVQVAENRDIDLNSDLVYCNHSCDPNVIFDVQNFEVRVVQNKPLKRGDDITFFYPSTEWDMEQPFQCYCGAERCLGSVGGAKNLDDATLNRYWLNAHIERLLATRGNGDSRDAGKLKKIDSVLGARN